MTEPLDPNKYHVITPAGKRGIIFLGLFLVLIVFPFLIGQYYKIAVNRPSQSGKETYVEIERGEGVSEVSKKLVNIGAINSDFLFNVYVYTKKLGDRIQAGVYTIPAGSSLAQVVDIIQHGTNDISLTFVEGWRAEEFARLASASLSNIDFQEFMEKAAEREGYLFPDTYSLNREMQEGELVERLTSTFNEKTANVLTDENLKKAGLTKNQAIIFASMLEREVHSEEDRPVVAGIMIKRWKEGMLLDIDATTQYVAIWQDICGVPDRCNPTYEQIQNLNWWPGILTQDDLELDSPYNTRKNVGLPPAPISNPGLSAIEAVLNWQTSPYYYYLTDHEGQVHYAVTLDQHNANVSQYLY